MDSAQFSDLAARLMRCPVAPGHEEIIAAEIQKICSEHKLTCRRDQYGNLLVSLRTNFSLRPLALAAHMDHPGFHIRRRLTSGKWVAEFRGGVPEHYFRPGMPVHLMPGRIKAVVGRALGKGKQYELKCAKPHAAPGQKFTFAVWNLPDFEVKNGCIYSRGCDDIGGVTAVLATLIQLRRTRARVNLLGLISRAEEVGFYGALTLAVSGQLPPKALIVSLETSAEMPPVKMGEGVVLRVGDRASIFDSEATRFFNEICLRLQKQCAFKFQRALMSGGTCEATVYQQYGFQTAALSLPLGNYHNCGPHGKIAPEFITISDACGMVELLAEAARKIPEYPKLVSKLPKRLDGLLKKAKKLLKSRSS